MLCIFQFDVRASDDGVPIKSAFARVIVSIERDSFPPTFQPNEYFITVLETEAVNNPLSTVLSATDGDANVR